jgi:predicted membrane protein
MRPSRIVILLWVALIVVLLGVLFSEISHRFTLPVQSWLNDPLFFVFALVFTTILALVGAIFIGIYVSQRLLSPSGFTPFEEEMLRMRADLRDMKKSVEEMESRTRGRVDDAGPEATEEPP